MCVKPLDCVFFTFRNYCNSTSSTTIASRRAVRRVNPRSLQWFPGHMRKGMADINKRMGQVDVILEIHDARVPFTGRAEFTQQFGQIRPRILLYNKTDLAEIPDDLSSFRAQLMNYSPSKKRTQPPNEIYFTQLNSPEKQQKLLRHLLQCLPLLVQSELRQPQLQREFSSDSAAGPYSVATPKSIMGLVLGIPNCGKSTLLNALRSFAQGGVKKAVRVGRTAGQTRSVGQPVVISPGSLASVQHQTDTMVTTPHVDDLMDCRIMLMDTPGILEPRAPSLTGQLSLAVCGAMNLDQIDKELLVDYLLFWWNRRQRFQYVSVLDLPGPTENIVELLARVCARNRFFLPANQSSSMLHRGPSWCPVEVESSQSLPKSPKRSPDFRHAADYILRQFDRGVFGRTTFLPEDELAASQFFVSTDA